MTCDPLDRICLPLWVGVSDKTSSDPTDTFMGSNFPTFPFALPTGGAEPLSVSHVYPPKVNSLGPVIEEDPLPEVPVAEVPVQEVPVPEVPAPEVPVPEVPVPEVPVPEVPVPEVPVPEVPVPEVP